MLTSTPDTIITSFPSGIYSDSPSGVQDLYLGIVKSLTNHPQQLETVEDMYSLLIKEAAGYMFNGVNMSSVDMMGIYRWVTGDKVNAASSILYKIVKIDCSQRLLLRQLTSRNFKKATPAADMIRPSSTTATT